MVARSKQKSANAGKGKHKRVSGGGGSSANASNKRSRMGPGKDGRFPMPKVMCLERRGCYKENGHPGQCVNGDCFGLSTDRSDQRKVRPVGWNYMACRRYMKKERQVAGWTPKKTAAEQKEVDHNFGAFLSF